MLKAIIFDFDGTIVDSKQATMDHFRATFDYFGLPVPEEAAFQGLLGLKTTDILKRLLPEMSEEARAPIYEISKDMSLRFATEIRMMPGVLPVLKRLNPSYKLALVTNRGKKSLSIILHQNGLKGYFDTIVDREDVRLHKPHPEALETAMRRLGVISPEQVLFVGDSDEDVAAAHNAGLQCVFVSATENHPRADFRLRTLSQLPELLRILESP